MRRPIWIHRPLANLPDVCAWAVAAGVRKIMPPEQLHLTLATVRDPVEWDDLKLREDDLVIPEGPKPVQIFAWSIKAMAFDDPAVASRHAELLARFPGMDHPRLRQHMSLFKGGRMPTLVYQGRLVFGPERAEEFDAANTQGIKHVKVSDLM